MIVRIQSHYSRSNTMDLKLEMERRVGRQKAVSYFSIINRFFSLKLSKNDFNKLCIATIGIENVSLHNRLIRAIVTNACLAEAPSSKRRKINATLDVKSATNGYQKSSIQSLEDVFVLSPKRERTRVRRFKDRPSPLAKIQEQAETTTELVSVGSRPPCEGNSEEDGEEVEQAPRSPVRAPLGVTFTGKATKKLLRNESTFPFIAETCHSACELPSINSLKGRLQKKLEIDGYQVSDDFVHLLNNGLNVYMKRLIKPCLELAGSKHGNSHHPNRGFNGSLVDFRVAMELNPSILGEEWPSQLEQIYMRASEEYYVCTKPTI